MVEEASVEPTKHNPAPRWGVALVWIVLIGVLGVVGFRLLQVSQGPLELGEPAPDFELTTFDGKHIATTDLRGQVIVVNVWASWCLSCKDEAVELEQAYQLLKDRGVVFIGVDWSDTETKARAYLEKYGITYPTGIDVGGRIHRAYRVTGVPETFVVDPNGILVGMRIGPFISYDDIVATVESALKQ